MFKNQKTKQNSIQLVKESVASSLINLFWKSTFSESANWKMVKKKKRKEIRLTFGSRWPGHSWSQTCAWGPGHQRGDRKAHLPLQIVQGPNEVDSPSGRKGSCLRGRVLKPESGCAIRLISAWCLFLSKKTNKPVTVAGSGSASSSHVSKIFL